MYAEYETKRVFRIILITLEYLGLYPAKNAGVLYYIYSFLLNIIVTVYYPITMVANLFLLEDTSQLFGNASVTFADAMSAMKSLNTFFKRKQLRRINELLEDFDRRVEEVNDHDEQRYLAGIIRTANRILLSYFIPFTGAALTCFLPAAFSENRRLLYSAWFPFDWKNSDTAYYIIIFYQLIGIWINIYQSMLCDSYPGLYLWILKGHFHALNIRVSKIGHDLRKTGEDYYQELKKCIGDHKKILEYRDVFEETFSEVLLMQFFVTELTLCITAVYVFYVDSMGEIIYMGVYFLCMASEIFLPCYCGNEVFYENEQFTDALYSCNWLDQDKKFKQALLFTMQIAKEPIVIYAGGVIKILPSTLFAVFKSTYSLFTIVNQKR
ncbi:odorant receptor 2a-like [Hermetia illucens]|nr:odorant receptor 2a-like [Hermetia illucens]